MSSRPDVLPPSKTYKPKDSNPSASTSNGFDMLDARLDHLRDTIFPPAPYVLTVPTKLPFNLSGEQVEDWVEGTPFAPKEAHLQYMSFRKDWDNGLITPIGGMLDDKGELIDEEKEKEKEKEKRKSAAGTPKVGAKKISLAEYKQQRKPGASLTNGTNGIPKINGEAKADKTIGSVTETSSKTIGLKRSLEETKLQDGASSGLESQAVKRARRTPSPRNYSPKRPDSDGVSPRKPAKGDETPDEELEVPPLLSPTLPPAVERELARLDALEAAEKAAHDAEKSSAEKGSASDVSGSSAALPAKGVAQSKIIPDNTVSGVNSKPDEKRGELSSHKGDKAMKVTKVPSPLPSKGPVITFPNLTRAKPISTTAKTIPASMPSLVKPSGKKLLVKMKYPRSMREDIRAIQRKAERRLRDSNKLTGAKPPDLAEPASQSSRPSSRRDEQQATEARPKGIARPKAKGDAKPDELSKPRDKRSQPEDKQGSQDRPSKRHKPSSSPSSISRPTTPVPSAFRSPVASQHSGSQKARDLTPSVFSRHDDPVKTPQGSNRNGTPLAPTSAERPLRPDSAIGGVARRDDLAVLSSERKRLGDLGRKLKHDGDPLHPKEDDTRPRKDHSTSEKRGIALAIESSLSFMLNYTLADEHSRLTRQANDAKGTWATIHSYIGRVLALAERVPALHGLCLYLRAVCLRAHWTVDYEAFATNPTAERHVKLKRCFDDSSRSFADAATRLPPAEWEKRFPKTWRASARMPCAATGRAGPLPLAGEFFVPLTEISTPVEAVRAAKSMLTEWCRAEGVEWKASIGV